MWLRTALACALAGPVLLTGGCGGTSSSTGGGSGSGALQADAQEAPAATVDEIDALKFSPPAVAVRTGDVVRWENTGSVTHNVTFQDQGVRSPNMDSGSTFTIRFTSPGTYHYRCTIHAGMAGIISVT